MNVDPQEKGNPLQYSCLENSMDRPWGRKQPDTMERLIHTHNAAWSCSCHTLLEDAFISLKTAPSVSWSCSLPPSWSHILGLSLLERVYVEVEGTLFSVAGKDWRQEEKGTTEDEMVGWRHRLDGHDSEQAPGIGDGQGSLACCSPWGRKELDTTEWLNWTELNWKVPQPQCKGFPLGFTSQGISRHGLLIYEVLENILEGRGEHYSLPRVSKVRLISR